MYDPRLVYDPTQNPIANQAGDGPHSRDERYGIDRKRYHDDGLAVMPVCGPPGTPPEIMRVHAGYEIEEIIVDTISENGPPKTPHFQPADPNLVFMSGTQITSVPMISGRGGHCWTMNATYIYAHVATKGLAADFPTGKMPFDHLVENGSENTIPGSLFIQGIIGIPSTTPSRFQNSGARGPQ